MKLDLSDIPRNPRPQKTAASQYFEEIDHLLELGYNFTETIDILKSKGVYLVYVSAKQAYERRQKRLKKSDQE
jgi:hypothetical protein